MQKQLGEDCSVTVGPLRAGERYINDFELAEITGRARSTWQKMRMLGTGPRFYLFGRLVRYRLSDVEAWVAAQPSRLTTTGGRRPSAQNAQAGERDAS